MILKIIFLTIFYATDLIEISKGMEPQNKIQSELWNRSKNFLNGRNLIRSAWATTVQTFGQQFQNITNQIKKGQSQGFVPILKEIYVAIFDILSKICACLREKIKIILVYILDGNSYSSGK